MAAWEFCLQDGGVSEGFAHKMAAGKFCLQDGGVSEGFTHKMAAWEFCLQDGSISDSLEYIHVLRLQCRIYLSECHLPICTAKNAKLDSLIGIPSSTTPSLFHSRLKTFLFCKTFPP